MKSLDYYDCIKRPIVTEKACVSFKCINNKKYIFSVNKFCNKFVIAKVVKKLFNVSVYSVNIINTKKKAKTFKGKLGHRSSIKKAIVTLDKGLSIDIYNTKKDFNIK